MKYRRLITFALALTLTVPTIAFEGIDDARKLVDQGQTEQAVSLLEKLAEKPGHEVEALVMLCELLTTKEGYKDAVEYGEKAVEKDPDNAEARYRYSLALVAKLQHGNMFAGYGASREYRKQIRKAIELDPNHVAARQHEILYYARSVGALGGDKEKALGLAEELTEINRGLGLFEQGNVYKHMEKNDKALDAYERAAELIPDNMELIYNLGMAYVAEKDYDEARAVFDRGTDKRELGVYLAVLYQRARSRIFAEIEPEAAVNFMEEFVGKREGVVRDGLPSISAAYWRMGQAYELMGNIDKAVEAYKSGTRVEPVSDNNEKALERLGKS